MSERNLNTGQIEAMAIIGPLVEWRFDEVFIDDDWKKFLTFFLGVRAARQNQFTLRFPTSDGSFYAHYQIPAKGEGYLSPRIWMENGEQALPESLLDVLSFDVGQTSLFTKDREDFQESTGD